MTTEIAEVFEELGAGTFSNQITEALNEVYQKTCEHGSFGKQGEIIIAMKFTPGKTQEGDQFVISSKITKKVPTATGHKTEDFNHETPFFLDNKGQMCAYVPEESPDGQKNIDI